jgi:hypothetical protein
MKKLLLTAFVWATFSVVVNAQSFTIQSDTVYSTPVGVTTILDGVTATSTSVTIGWKVIGSDFPANWVSVSGVCDNNLCHNLVDLWPSGTMESSNSYPALGHGDFHMLLNLDTVSTTGTYYVRVRLNNLAIPADTAIETYIVSKPFRTAAPIVTRTASDVVLYPNPATNEINVVYDAGADVKCIAVYNVIGKMAAIYKTSGYSANLDLGNIPSGIYFIRLVNAQGNIVATKKFTKL